MHQLQKTADPGGVAARIGAFFLPFAAGLVADQWSKAIIFARVPESGYSLLPGFFDLVRFENHGAFASLPVANTWAAVLAAAAIVFIALTLFFYDRTTLAGRVRAGLCGFALIAAGGIGNLADRIRLGYVRDVFQFFHLSVWNLADMMVVSGFIIAIILSRPVREGQKNSMDKQKMLGWIIGIVVVAGLVYLAVTQGPKGGQKPVGLEPPPAAVTGEPTVLGAILPLTGDAASYGIPIQRAIEMAVADINAVNGAAGKPLKVQFEDGKCDGKEGANAAQKLINVNKVKFIIGGVCSGETLGFAPIANANRVIVISPSATSPDITTKGGPYVFRFSPSDALAGSVAARYAREKLGAKTAAIVSEQTDYAQGLRRTFANEFRTKGRIVVDETFQGSETNFQSIALKIKEKKPDVIYLLPQTPTPGVLLAKQLRAQNVTGSLLTAEVLIGRDTVEKNAEDLDGLVGFEAYFDEGSERAKPFLGTYRVRYGEAPPFPFFMANAYSITYLIKDLIEQNGVDTAKAVSSLATLKGWAGGALGNVSLDRAGDPIWTEYAVKQVFQGNLKDVMVFKAQ